MTCSNPGPFHLGISEEACENSGGKWFRSPCITLKEAIDMRPAKFDLEQSHEGNCQQVMGQMNLAYVSAATDDADFGFASTKQGCLEFCRSLPHYSNQLAMMTDSPSTSTTGDDVSKCTCLFEYGMLTTQDEVPEHATKSHPKFHITNPIDGTALGIPIGYDCASSEISIETQDFAGSSRQQFMLTHDHQLVSVACPDKALSADCTAQTAIFSAPIFSGDTSTQLWSFEADGGIVNMNCSDLKLASTKSSPSVITSTYFTLINPTSGLAMGIDGGTDCIDGMNITLQQAVSGSPDQLFYVDGSTDEVVSLRCPNLAISLSDESSCNSNDTVVQLKSSADATVHTWQFNGDTSIESSSCSGEIITVQTNGRLSASSGDQLSLTDPSSSLLHQKWSRSYQQFTISSGPYTFTNPATGKAIGLVDDSCTYGTVLEEQTALGGTVDAKQQFYIGNGGMLHSLSCPGLVISNSGIGEQLTLETATDDSSKWTVLSDGFIESVQHPDAAIGIDGSSIVLASKEASNAALNKPASQNHFFSNSWPTSNGVDGDRNTHTKSKYWSENDWWRVDLQAELVLDRIVIVAGPERLNSNTYMQLLDSSEAVVYEIFIDILSRAEQSFDVNGIVAQYVKLGNDQAGSFSLQIAEVEVYPQTNTVSVSGVDS